MFRTQYIIPHKLDSIYIKSITYGSIINLILNFIFIPKYGGIGAVIGTLTAELFVPIYQYIKLRKVIQYGFYIKKTIAYPIIGFIMFLILKILEKVLKLKVQQNPVVLKKLLETKDYIIAEYCTDEDTDWGLNNQNQGQNNLGKIWMKIRDEFTNSNIGGEN